MIMSLRICEFRLDIDIVAPANDNCTGSGSKWLQATIHGTLWLHFSTFEGNRGALSIKHYITFDIIGCVCEHIKRVKIRSENALHYQIIWVEHRKRPRSYTRFIFIFFRDKLAKNSCSLSQSALKRIYMDKNTLSPTTVVTHTHKDGRICSLLLKQELGPLPTGVYVTVTFS